MFLKYSAMVGGILFFKEGMHEGLQQVYAQADQEGAEAPARTAGQERTQKLREMLHLLERGMRDALVKGYNRGEMRRKIAEAEVIIAATTLKGFLVKEQKDAGQKHEEATTGEADNSGQRSEGETAGKAQKVGRKQGEETAGAGQPDGMKGQGALESSAGNSVGNEPRVRPEHGEEAAGE